MVEIFTNILQDQSLNSTYMIIDILDECIADLLKLLDFIVHKLSVSPYVKWIVFCLQLAQHQEAAREDMAQGVALPRTECRIYFYGSQYLHPVQDTTVGRDEEV